MEPSDPVRPSVRMTVAGAATTRDPESRSRCALARISHSLREECRLVLLCLFLSTPSLFGQGGDVGIIINGLGGMPEYEENFVQWSEKLVEVLGKQLGHEVLRLDGRSQGREEIMSAFRETVSSLSQEAELWLFLVGHANHAEDNYKLHIRGPDLTDTDLKMFFDSLGERKVYLVAATSASGALIPSLSGPHRVIVTATKNRFERQPPLFLSFFLEAASSAEADSDKNGKVSLLEAFLFSRQKVADWFEERGRLQTEHPLLDDRSRIVLGRDDAEEEVNLRTGEGLLASVAYLSAPPERAYRTLEAQQLAAQSRVIEREIEDLKFRKQELNTAEYYRRLEELLVKLATLNEKIAELEGGQ